MIIYILEDDTCTCKSINYHHLLSKRHIQHSVFFVINNFFFFFFSQTTQHNIQIKQNKTADTYSTSQGSIKREGEREGQQEHKSYSFK